jgi:hypothetical protein
MVIRNGMHRTHGSEVTDHESRELMMLLLLLRPRGLMGAKFEKLE